MPRRDSSAIDAVNSLLRGGEQRVQMFTALSAFGEMASLFRSEQLFYIDWHGVFPERFQLVGFAGLLGE